MLAADNSGAVATTNYQLIGVVATFRLNQNNTTTPLMELTVRSTLYDVQFTWDVTKATFDGSGGQVLASEKTAQVNEIAALPHVQALRSEKEQDRSDLLYNYLVVTVGTQDLAITDDVAIRMDAIGTPGAFTAINEAWARLVAAGAPAGG